jgi:nucleoside phosphorylase
MGKMTTTTATLRNTHDYTVAWVCALPLEMAAAKSMLDEIHPNLPNSSSDQNTYVLGKIHTHNVVIACLPSGIFGTTSAATVANQMLCTFRSIRFGLMVGIGGGVPTKEADIRLGDVVVSKPTEDFGGVVQYDFGRTVGQGVFQRTGTLNKPPQMLLTAIARLQADQMMEISRIPEFLSEMIAKYPGMRAGFTYRGQGQDRLFDAASDHHGLQNTCDTCDTSRLVTRPVRDRHDPVVHYGLIASGNKVIKHGGTRDKLGQELGILCFEMEAAGLMDNFPCLVIRGICDYADSHKNKEWEGYAAATAAAYAKELLSVIHSNQVEETPAALDTNLQDISQCVSNG